VIKYSPSGALLVVSDNSDYVIYKAQGLKNIRKYSNYKQLLNFLDFGTGGHTAWSNDNGFAAASGS
jgi:hypothetical protein